MRPDYGFKLNFFPLLITTQKPSRSFSFKLLWFVIKKGCRKRWESTTFFCCKRARLANLCTWFFFPNLDPWLYDDWWTVVGEDTAGVQIEWYGLDGNGSKMSHALVAIQQLIATTNFCCWTSKSLTFLWSLFCNKDRKVFFKFALIHFWVIYWKFAV